MENMTEAQAILDIEALKEIAHRWQKQKYPEGYGIMLSYRSLCAGKDKCKNDCALDTFHSTLLHAFETRQYITNLIQDATRK